RNGINTITAGKNLPAMLVTGNLIVESGGELEIEGLAVIDGDMRVSAGAAGVNLLGGLFIQGTLVETTADSSGNGNNGTIFGATQTVAGTGFALHFDGADDYVRIAVDPALDNLDAITMMARIYPRADSHWHVLDKGDGDKRIFSEGLNRTLDGRVRYTSVNAWSESAGGTIELNTWQYVALTWSPSTNSIRLFRDGIEVQYGPQNIGSGAALDDTTHPFTIGVRSGLNNGTFFDGLINDVRLYDRALDPNEIYPPNDSLPGLIGHWKLDESGSSVTITAAPSRTAIVTWSAAGVVEKWGQAAGAFFKSIERK
ncbi:MAG: LamG domain-containing protein, partial [Phycisphaerales bacterium]